MLKSKSASKDSFDKISVQTIIAEGIIIESGEIRGTGDIRIDGTFNGTVSLEGRLIVGKTGNVSGDVKARIAYFAGTYAGDMTILDTVRFMAGSNVTGQVEANKIIMDEGAAFKGHITSAKIFQEEAGI